MFLQRHIILLLLLPLMALTSCSLERELAREYVKNHKGEGVLLLPTDLLYKANPAASIDTTVCKTAAQQDSVAYFTSAYVQFVSDSIFLTLFTNALIDELEKYGYEVTLGQAADEFLGSDNPAWIIQLSQLQLEEDYTSAFAYGYDDFDEEYYQEYRNYTISLNSWTEVSRLNTNQGARQLLYLSGYIADSPGLGVTLQYYHGQFYMQDLRDTISIRNVYQMAEASGRKHAELLFDYFINDYIRRNYKDSDSPRKEMHYDPRFQRIGQGLYEKFELLR